MYLFKLSRSCLSRFIQLLLLFFILLIYKYVNYANNVFIIQSVNVTNVIVGNL